MAKKTPDHTHENYMTKKLFAKSMTTIAFSMIAIIGTPIYWSVFVKADISYVDTQISNSNTIFEKNHNDTNDKITNLKTKLDKYFEKLETNTEKMSNLNSQIEILNTHLEYLKPK